MSLFPDHSHDTDIILVGGGIMSATLGVFLTVLDPSLQIHIFERRSEVGKESSDALNNAGTGHSALCELNYTKRVGDGIDVSKPNAIIEKFEQSKQFWSYLVEQGALAGGNSFINRVPHMSLVFGEEDVQFLRDRHEAMTQNPLFSDMEYSEDHTLLTERFPLMMKGRDQNQPVAATRSELGTDVNFGQLTRDMIRFLATIPSVHLHTGCEVTDLTHHEDSSGPYWSVNVKPVDPSNTIQPVWTTKYLFLGSGGQAIPLLAKSGIPQGKKYGGFPVDGQRLVCNNPEIVNQHHGKVYGQASVGAPPMSVPHLDTRVINGKRSLLFGPYAGFTTKFLKKGHRSDLFRSITLHNIRPMIQVGARNLGLTKYLISEIVKDKDKRMESLRKYYPQADEKDRYREYAGKRVQIIKDDTDKGGVLQFGTEVVVSDDKTLSALLGASPGASTSVSIILEVLEQSFPEQIASEERKQILASVVPSYGTILRDNSELTEKVRTHTTKVLGLTREAFEASDYTVT